MGQGEPAAGTDGARSDPGNDHRVRMPSRQPERGGHHVHRVPWRCTHEDVKDAHPASHSLQFNRR